MADNRAQPTLPIVVTIVWGLLFLPGVLGALVAGTMFDAPGSANNPAAWMNAGLIVSFPILCILSIAGSWIVWAWHKRGPTRASGYTQIAVASLPLLPVAVVMVLVIVAWIRLIATGHE